MDYRQISSLGHKNLVRFLDAFEEDYHMHIVMALCQGMHKWQVIFELCGGDTVWAVQAASYSTAS